MYLETKQNGNPVVLSNVSNNHLSETAKKNWLSYWNHYKRTEFTQCSVEGCSHPHEHGILVKDQSANGNKLFVVPVCHEHSNLDALSLKVDGQLDVISAELTL